MFDFITDSLSTIGDTIGEGVSNAGFHVWHMTPVGNAVSSFAEVVGQTQIAQNLVDVGLNISSALDGDEDAIGELAVMGVKSVVRKVIPGTDQVMTIISNPNVTNIILPPDWFKT